MICQRSKRSRCVFNLDMLYSPFAVQNNVCPFNCITVQKALFCELCLFYNITIVLCRMSYDNDYGSISDIPEAARSYIRGFQSAIDSQNVDEILQYYETDWNKMTERFYKTQPWPHWKVVEEFSGDGVFILLYKGTLDHFTTSGFTSGYFRTVLPPRVHVVKRAIPPGPDGLFPQLL